MAVAELGLKIESQQAETAEKRLKSMAGAADQAEESSEKLSKTQLRLAETIGRSVVKLAAFAATAFSIRAVFSTLSEFESSMSGVQAVTRATADEMAQLRDISKELGATTEYTAGQVADGLRFLGMAGFTTAEALEAIPAVLDLATAASMGLADAADISSNMMSAFGIEASRAAEVADVLASAASRANTDVRQMGEGMKFVGPVAAAMGISINDTAAAIGALSDAGIQGGMAGTSLRRILSSLANPTDKAAKALRGLGISVDQVNPSTTSLVDIIRQLSDAGIDAAEALEIFGDRGGPALLALVENNAKLAELTDTLTDVGGAAKTMADIMRDNIRGDFDNLTSAVEGLIIAIGEAGLTAAIRVVMRALTGLIRLLTKAAEAAEIFAVALGLIAFTRIPAMIGAIGSLVAWLATAEGLFIAGAVAARGLAIAMNLIPGVAILTALSAAITGVVKGFRESSKAAKAFADAINDVQTAQEDLDRVLSDFYSLRSDENAKAVKEQAEMLLAYRRTALAAAEAELAAASFYTNLFGYSLYETERMSAARQAIEDLKADIIEAEAIISAMDHATEGAVIQLDALHLTASILNDEFREMVAGYERRTELALLENQYGRESIPVMAAKLAQARALVVAQLDAADATDDVRRIVLDAYDAMVQAESAGEAWGLAVKSVRDWADRARAALDEMARAQPGDGWLDTAIGKAAQLAGTLWDAAAGMMAASGEGGTVTRPRARPNDIDFGVTIPGRVGGGVGGGGGGARAEQQTRISALIESLQTEQEIIAQWHAQAQLDLIQASDAELDIIGGRNEAKLRLEKEYQERMAAIRGAYQGSALENTQTFMGEMASALQSGNERMQEIGAVFASVEALINAYRAYNQVIADPTLPWFAKIPAAVGVLAAGMRTVASIKALGGGGGASASGGGGASSVPQQQQSAPPRQTRAIIQAVGGRSRFTIDEINDIIAGIQKENKDGVIIEGFVT